MSPRWVSIVLVALAAPPTTEAAGGKPLKIVILAGQSNMEGQAEVDMKKGKACATQPPGQAPTCCSAKNVTGCCSDHNSHGKFYPCVPRNNTQGAYNSDPCPHDAIQGPTNDMCYINGTLVYQLKDPRTAKLFAPVWDGTLGYNKTDGMPLKWTVLDRVKTWQNEGVGELNHVPKPPVSLCPKGYCPVTGTEVDPTNKSRKIPVVTPCSTALPLGGCGAWGNMTVGYGVGSSMHHIGPEFGFSFTMDQAMQEDILVIKVNALLLLL